MAFITHNNSPAHNSKLGMNMKVKAVSLSSVAEKIEKIKKLKKNEAENELIENFNDKEEESDKEGAKLQ